MANNEDVREQIVSKIGIKNIEESLTKMGFTISPCEDNEKLVKVILPENYTAIVVSEKNHTSKTNDGSKRNFHKDSFSCQQIVNIDFFDETNIKRGSFLINTGNKMGSSILLAKRLGLHTIMHGTMQEIYIGTENSKLISFGSVNTEIGSALYIASQMGTLQDKLKAAATEIYPDWKNPLAYWELTDEELLAMVPKENLGETRIRTNSKVSTSSND